MSKVALDPTTSHPLALLAAGVPPCLEWGAAIISLVLAKWMVASSFDENIKVLVVTLAVALLVGWIVVQDLRSLTIADGATISLASIALASRWSAGDTPLALAFDGLSTGGVLLAVREVYYRRKGFDGLGLGDVKLATAGGLLLGASAFAWALMGASLVALGAAAFGRAGAGSPQVRGSDKLAFGAVLAPTIWLTWVAQHASILLPFDAGS